MDKNIIHTDVLGKANLVNKCQAQRGKYCSSVHRYNASEQIRNRTRYKAIASITNRTKTEGNFTHVHWQCFS